MIVSLLPFKFITTETVALIQKQSGEQFYQFDNSPEAIAALPDAEILIVFGGFSKDIFINCPKLKWVFSISAGVEKLPFPELIEKGVIVTNTRGNHGPQMAEQTMGIILAFSRNLNHSTRNQLQKKWDQFIPVEVLTGKTLCIIGAGSIGKEIARKAKAFDLKVIGLKSHPEPLDHFDEVWGIDQLHQALQLADYTVLITPLTDETYYLIGASEFKAMKPTSIFINISRGDTVDEAAMIKALQNGDIAGAGLDVFHEEPLPNDSPLWEMENVIITPHNAGFEPNYMEKAIHAFLESLALYRQGKSLPNRIDLKQKY